MADIEKVREVAKQLAEEDGGETGLATVAAIIYLAECVKDLTEEVKKDCENCALEPC